MSANQRSGQLNSSRLLREIWLNRGISRIEAARLLELDKSTITLLVNKMLKQGVLETLSEGASGPKGGRKPQGLGINACFGYFLGVEMLPDGLRTALVDLQGHPVKGDYRNIPLENSSVEKDLLPHLQAIYNEYKDQYNILGIGLALSGIVDPYKGKILQSMLLNISNPLPLTELASAYFPCDFMVENDANCCAWGELVQNRVRELKDFLYILIESDLLLSIPSAQKRFSLGMGIVFDGKVYHGKQFSSGEFKSILWNEHSNSSQFSLGLNQLGNLRNDKELRMQLFREISQNIAFLTNTLNLNHLYIGGDIESYWDEFRTILEDEIQRNWSYQDRVSCEIRLASQGEFSAAYGAAAMHLERVFASNQASFYQEQSQKIGLEALNIE